MLELGSLSRIRDTYRCCDNPIDVSNIKNLSVNASNLWVATLKLDGNGSISKIRSHSEICNCSDKSDRGSNVVENSVSSRNCEAQPDENKGRSSHDTGDSPVPVRSTNSKIDIAGSWVGENIRICFQSTAVTLDLLERMD